MRTDARSNSALFQAPNDSLPPASGGGFFISQTFDYPIENVLKFTPHFGIRGVLKLEVLEIGQCVDSWRIFRNLSTTALARLCTLQPGYITRVQQGKVKLPGINNLGKIAAALQIPPSVLLLGIEPQDLITPDVPRSREYLDTPGGIEFLLAIRFINQARTKNPTAWLYQPDNQSG